MAEGRKLRRRLAREDGRLRCSVCRRRRLARAFGGIFQTRRRHRRSIFAQPGLARSFSLAARCYVTRPSARRARTYIRVMCTSTCGYYTENERLQGKEASFAMMRRKRAKKIPDHLAISPAANERASERELCLPRELHSAWRIVRGDQWPAAAARSAPAKRS